MRNARPTAREWQEALKQGEKRQKGEPPKPPPPQAPAEEDIRQMQSRKTTATALILLVVPTQVMLEVFLLVNIPDYAFLLAAAAKVVTFLSTGIAYIRWVATADRNLEKIHGQDRYMRAGTFWLLLPWTVPPFNAINPVIQMRRLTMHSNPEQKDSAILLGLWLGFTIFAGVSAATSGIYTEEPSIRAAVTTGVASYGSLFISATICAICMGRVTRGTTKLAS